MTKKKSKALQETSAPQPTTTNDDLDKQLYDAFDQKNFELANTLLAQGASRNWVNPTTRKSALGIAQERVKEEMGAIKSKSPPPSTIESLTEFIKSASAKIIAMSPTSITNPTPLEIHPIFTEAASALVNSSDFEEDNSPFDEITSYKVPNLALDDTSI